MIVRAGEVRQVDVTKRWYDLGAVEFV